MMTSTSSDESSRTSIWQLLSFSTETEIDRANNKRFTIWCMGWATAIIAATALITFLKILPGPVAFLIALIPNIFAVGSLIAYMRLLRMTDELQRKIHIEGLAVGFGVGWIFAIGYQVLEAAGAPTLSVTAMILILSAGWMVGTGMAIRQYK